MSEASFRFPEDDEHYVALGHNGSGKTVAAAFVLSKRSFDQIPWFIMDAKRDGLLGSLGAERVDIRKPPTRHAGLYRVPYDEGSEDEIVEAWIRKLCDTIRNGKRQGAGLFVDEGYSIPKGSPAFRKVLTQGRALRLPAMINSQRPVWMDRYAWSETLHKQYFHLTDAGDRKMVEQFSGINTAERLPRYHSYWWAEKEQQVFKLAPTPKPDIVKQLFRDRLGTKRRGRRI